MTDRPPEISIIIPTYNERENIAAVVRDIFLVARLHRYALEVVIVDDNSPDGTGQEADRLAAQFPVVVIHRTDKLGLGTALVAGLHQARGRIVGLMDGDRSHPAEVLPQLIEPIRQGRCQLALASRYAPGGSVEYWPWHRWVLSHWATLLARPFARGVRDPLSGFICFERSVVEGVPLTVHGYKIGLEILIKGRYKSLIEVPYTFRNRGVGRSKLGWAEYLNFLKSLGQHGVYLLRHRRDRQLLRHAAALRDADAAENGEPAAARQWGPCPLCGADNAAFLFVKNTYRHARCRACGLVYVSPAPLPAELEAIYQDARYFSNRNEWAYGYNDYFAEREFYIPLFDRRVRQCERALGIENGNGRRLLDVGCAAGFLLEAARARGWEVAGVELSGPAADLANEKLGGVVFQGTIEQARFETESFDCVVMLDVVEHVSDPLALILEAQRVLKPGGLLLLSAPNLDSLSARAMGRRWFHFKRDHVVLFSAATILRALDAAGLDCFDLRRNGKMVSLGYLFARLKVYLPAAGKLLLATVGRLALCRRLFYDSWTGELLAFARKRDPAGPRPASADQVYSRFRARWWLPTALWRTAEYFRMPRIETSGPILDLGCGDGWFARDVIPRPLHGRLVGVDRRRADLVVPQRCGQDGHAVCADAQTLPFRSETFGLVLANCSLEHVGPIEEALAEVARLLAPDGRLVFTAPSEHFGRLLFFSNLFRRIGLRPLARAYEALVNRLLGHQNLFDPDKWRELLESAGLRLEHFEYFMPAPLARAWDRRLWLGLPGWVFKRLLGRRPCPHPHLHCLPASMRDHLTGSCSEGAGAIYYSIKKTMSSDRI